MVIKNLLQALKDIGLNEKEAQIYILLFRLGPQPVSIIAKKETLHRSSCYIILERLMKKGLIQKIIQNNNAAFKAVEPVYVIDQLKTKQYELESKIQNLGFALKDFDRQKNGYQVKPKIIFFQDETGLQNALENSVTSSEPLRCYASYEELDLFLPNYMPRYYQKRIHNGVKVRAIYPATYKSFLHKKRDKFELRESRLIPQEFNFDLDIMVYENKVVITSLKEKFGVLIESKEIAAAQKKIFDLLWEASKSYDEKISEHFEKIFIKNKRASHKRDSLQDRS